MLKIWGRRNSSNVQKVMWLVGELGLEHAHISVGGKFGGLDDPAYRAMNPHGRIPVIRDGDLVVWESQAILRYLAAQYGRGVFWPESPAERSVADSWGDWGVTGPVADFNAFFWAYFRTPEAERDWALIEKLRAGVATHFRVLDAMLGEREFLAGDRLSLADIPIGCALYRYFELDIGRPELPNLAAFSERLRSRPAYREHVMIPFEELRGRTVF
jgi:glutathione S-transferase